MPPAPITTTPTAKTMSDQTKSPPAPAVPTRTPTNRKDIALQSALRMFFYMHTSMRAQAVDKTPLAVAIHACLQLCASALPNKFHLSNDEVLRLILAAKSSVELANESKPAVVTPGKTLPTPGNPIVLGLDQLKQPIKKP